MKARIATIGLLFFLVPILAYGGNIDLKKAIEIATREVPGDVIKVELKRGIYEVKIRTKGKEIKEVYVNAADGSIVKRRNISLDEALTIATREVPGEVVKVEFERGVYEVKIRTPEGYITKVYIDGRDGSIIKGKRYYRYRDDDYWWDEE